MAPGAWGEVVAGAEGGLEVAGVGEAGALGDLVEGEVGGEEEAFDVAEAEAEDFVFGGAAEGGFHAALESAAGGVEGEAEVVDGEAFVAALADEAGGASDEGVGDDKVVGGFAGDDLAGRDEDCGVRIWECGFGLVGGAHEGVEEAGGFVADAGAVEFDGGEGWGGEGAEGFVVFAADDGDFLGDGEAGAEAGVEEVDAELVVGGEDADGFGEGAELGDEAGLAGFPVGGAVGSGAGELGAGEAALLEAGDEVLDALDEEGFGGEAVDGEVAVAAVEEVFGDGLADEAVVDTDEGAVMGEGGGAEFDGGEAGGGDGAVHGRGEGAGEDAVALPVFEPGGGWGVGGAEFDKGGPGSVLGDVAADAGEDLAGVGAGGFDEEGDAGDHGDCGLRIADCGLRIAEGGGRRAEGGGRRAEGGGRRAEGGDFMVTENLIVGAGGV